MTFSPESLSAPHAASNEDLPNQETITPTLSALQRLIEVVAQLRSPDGGCPWDLEQTPQTLIPYVIEEAYEVVDAIRQGDPAAIADELGDLLLQVVLQAQIAKESAQFDLTTVAHTIADKLVRRHPHVFGDVAVDGVAQVRDNWDQIKTAEDQQAHDTQSIVPQLQRYGRSLPPLTACMKISHKAAKAGLEWESVAGVWDKFHEELDEFQQAIAHESAQRQQDELGDLLFTLVNLARWHNLNPDEALQSANQRFTQRVALLESATLKPLADHTLAELEVLWQQAKTIQAQE
ncbi:MAG: nucleoside triphosphate pyrophosphohydrolase [Kaiparowitsia implicata GSE-PSE-MK54-09C]|jgi:XTP/dITP diphosphohydrolase|nr:nucleoside triphosphate pyrophosphohydrolase [Kaiparowitsia implicata GSE-PSE-MK54-09C]